MNMRQKSFRSFSRAAMMLLMMLLTATTAGAADVTPTNGNDYQFGHIPGDTTDMNNMA